MLSYLCLGVDDSPGMHFLTSVHIYESVSQFPEYHNSWEVLSSGLTITTASSFPTTNDPFASHRETKPSQNDEKTDNPDSPSSPVDRRASTDEWGMLLLVAWKNAEMRIRCLENTT